MDLPVKLHPASPGEPPGARNLSWRRFGRALQEDQEDLAAFEERVNEPLLTYEELLKDLKKHGKL